MYSAGQRSAAVFFHGVSVIFLLVVASWVSVAFDSPAVDADIKFESVRIIGLENFLCSPILVLLSLIECHDCLFTNVFKFPSCLNFSFNG